MAWLLLLVEVLNFHVKITIQQTTDSGSVDLPAATFNVNPGGIDTRFVEIADIHDSVIRSFSGLAATAGNDSA